MSIAKKNIYASIPNPTRGKPTLLGGDPKGDKILYCVGPNVVIRSLGNPLEAELYSEHSKDCTVARFAPSGFYIASADIAGNVRIWDTTNAEHVLKIELKIISGPILDMDWSEDSKRLVAVGEGKEKFGSAFFFDSGASVGDITGHSKTITTCHFKPNRPYRLATGGEDNQVSWFEGPPFKFKKGITDHSRFVNCVRFNPTGTLLASVSSDKKGILYDAKEGTKVLELATDGGHAGGIYACSWNKSGDRLLTASADKTVKVWDVATGKPVQTYAFGNDTNDQQLGCLWQGDHLVSMSLSGNLALLDPNSNKTRAVIYGHNKNITALSVQGNNVYTGSYDGLVNRWELGKGIPQPVTGKGHTNAVVQLHAVDVNLYSTGMDDSVRITPTGALAYGADKIATDGLPADLAVGKSGVAVVATVNAVQVIRGGKVVGSVKSADSTAVAISPDESIVAVGNKANRITVYTLSGNNLTQRDVLEGHRGAITRIAYSPDGHHLVSADTNRELIVWPSTGKTAKITGWVFHSARINDVAWSPDNVHIASASLDQSFIVWNINDQNIRIQQKQAHIGGINTLPGSMPTRS